MNKTFGSTIAPVVLLLVLAGGCAKRPAVTAAAAPPAPSAAPPVVAAPPPAAPAPAAPPPPAPAPPPAAAAPTPPPPVAAAPPPPPPPVAPPPPPAPREYQANDAVKTIYFDFDDAKIRPGDAKILEANAKWLAANPSQIVLIEGHCDSRGTNEYNLALGDRRAKATTDYLVAQGIAASRITTISYGEERPFCADSGESCWSKNRRAQFLVKER
jgi:peptidoglycan-associated lipoprotein